MLSPVTDPHLWFMFIPFYCATALFLLIYLYLHFTKQTTYRLLSSSLSPGSSLLYCWGTNQQPRTGMGDGKLWLHTACCRPSTKTRQEGCPSCSCPSSGSAASSNWSLWASSAQASAPVPGHFLQIPRPSEQLHLRWAGGRKRSWWSAQEAVQATDGLQTEFLLSAVRSVPSTAVLSLPVPSSPITVPTHELPLPGLLLKIW